MATIDTKKNPATLHPTSEIDLAEASITPNFRHSVRPSPEIARLGKDGDLKIFKTTNNFTLEDQPAPGDFYEVGPEANEPGYFQDLTKRVAEHVNSLSPRIDLARVIIYDEKEIRGKPPIVQVEYNVSGYGDGLVVEATLDRNWKQNISEKVNELFALEQKVKEGRTNAGD